jgi:hypothetical protein
MKYISIKIVAIIALMGLSGCNDNLLEKLPQDQLSSGSFWTSEKETRLALNACYTYLEGGFNNAYEDASADNAYTQYPWEGAATSLSAGDIDATIDRGYRSRYKAIRQYNFFSR